MNRIKIKIQKDIQKGKYQEALLSLNDLIEKEPGNKTWLELRGEIWYLKQDYAKALNDYNKLLKTEPNNKIIRSKIEMIKYILKFQAVDIYASTNLNVDPWLDD